MQWRRRQRQDSTYLVRSCFFLTRVEMKEKIKRTIKKKGVLKRTKAQRITKKKAMTREKKRGIKIVVNEKRI